MHDQHYDMTNQPYRLPPFLTGVLIAPTDGKRIMEHQLR